MKLKKISVLLLIFVLIIFSGFAFWAYTPPKATNQALQALESDSAVQVTQENNWVKFSPNNQNSNVVFIFYPGGRVDYRAYAIPLRALAEEGITVYAVRMPFNLAVFGVNLADRILESTINFETRVIGGHSLGGVMAANYALNHLEMMDGVVFWASYPAESDDLSASNLAVLSIFGTIDGLSTPEKIVASEYLLPKDTFFEKIEGGNHAQFGSYGPQKGDNQAEISPEEQQSQIIHAMINFFKNLQ